MVINKILRRVVGGRKYENPIVSTHSRIILVRDMVAEFYDVYKDILSLRKKRQSSIAQLRKVMKYLKKTPEKLNKKEQKKLDKSAFENAEKLFDRSLRDIRLMMGQQEEIQISDVALLIKHAEELQAIYNQVKKSQISSQIRAEILARIKHSMYTIAKTLEHFWIVSKSQSRDLIELEEKTLVKVRGQKKRIRIQVIGLGHMENHLAKVKPKLKRLILGKHDTEEQEALMESVREMLEIYQEEIHTMEEVMHESKILIKTTEKLLREIVKEARTLGWEPIIKNVETVEQEMKDFLLMIEAQLRRAKIDSYQIEKRLTAIKELKIEHPKPVVMTKEEIEAFDNNPKNQTSP